MNTITPKRTQYRFVMLALITLSLALSTADRATLSIAGSAMSADLGITPVALGYLFSIFSWSYVICQVPAGWLADKIGSKQAMFWGILLWSLFTVMMGFVSYLTLVLPALLALRFLLGIAESPVGPSAGRIIAAWFPSSERGISGSIFNSAAYLSMAIFTPLMGWLCHVFGWQHVFIVMGAIGLLLALFWGKLFEVPTKHKKINPAELEYIKAGGGLVELDADIRDAEGKQQKVKGATLSEFGQLFKSRMLVGIFISQYCITSITWFFLSWFPIYLVKERGLSILEAGFIATVPAICGWIGGISSGFFSDYLLKRTGSLSIARKIPITFGLTLTTFMVGCNYVDSSWAVVGLMSAAFFGKGFGNLGFTVIADCAPKRIVGTTAGLMNALGNVSGIITPVVIGYLLARTGSFHAALVYVGIHGLLAILSYWVIVGKLQRLELNLPAAQYLPGKVH
ncbi:MFS transporter [Sodalis sp. RH21]|uniref:MFS transporter n=1 Tax=unclassified Sodalis (in: enterobacteria) TaxID=2636512 RepID=UPI0039B66A56